MARKHQYKEKIIAITVIVLLISFAFLGYVYASGTDDVTNTYRNNLKSLNGWKKEYARNVAKYTNIDGSQLKSALDQYEQILIKGKQIIDSEAGAADADYSEYWQITQGLGNLDQDINDGFQLYKNEKEWKNIAKDLTQRGKKLNNMKTKLKRVQKTYDKAVRKYATAAERQEILAQFKDLVSQVQDMIDKTGLILADAQKAAPKDTASYWMNYTDDLDGMQQDFNDLQNKVQQIGDTMNELKGVEQNVQKTEKAIKRYAGTQLEIDGHDLATEMKDYLQSAWKTLVADPDSAGGSIKSIYDLQKDWDGARQEYDQVQWDQPEDQSSTGTQKSTNGIQQIAQPQEKPTALPTPKKLTTAEKKAARLIAENYLKLVTSRDYGKAYDLFTDEVKAKMSRTDYIKEIGNTTITSWEVKEVLEEENGASVQIVINVRGDSETGPLFLVQKDGKWYINYGQYEVVKGIGDQVELATIKFTVNAVKEQQTIGNKYRSASAKVGAKFVVVDMAITNITKAGFSFREDILVDNQGRQFEPYSNTIGNIDNYLNNRKLSPGIPERGVEVFEIPTDATSYWLVAAKAGTNEVYKVILK